ncbi:MAG: DUF3267 domain-containing protein [Bacilli bacterium]|nr:DUF3267 domain-containing protein [Bacilli bacterium]
MKYYKYQLNMTLLNFLCVFLFFPLFVIMYLLDLSFDFSFLIFYFLWMFLHEFLHGFGFIINKGINRKNVVYGACLEKGILYCMCKQKIGKKCIMISSILPFFLIGIFTFFLGMIFNNKLLELLSLFNIVGSVGDLVMFFDFLRLPDFLYTDLDDCTGFVLISDCDLSKYNLFGMKLIDCGDDFGEPKFFSKFNFSKFSIIVFIVLIVALVVNLFFF